MKCINICTYRGPQVRKCRNSLCHCAYPHAVIGPRNVQVPPFDGGYPSLSTMENRSLSLSSYSLSLLVQDQLHTTTHWKKWKEKWFESIWIPFVHREPKHWTNGRLTSSLPVTYDGDFSFEKCGANATAYKDDKITHTVYNSSVCLEAARLVSSRLSHLWTLSTSSHNIIKAHI